MTFICRSFISVLFFVLSLFLTDHRADAACYNHNAYDHKNDCCSLAISLAIFDRLICIAGLLFIAFVGQFLITVVRRCVGQFLVAAIGSFIGQLLVAAIGRFVGQFFISAIGSFVRQFLIVTVGRFVGQLLIPANGRFVSQFLLATIGCFVGQCLMLTVVSLRFFPR